MAIFNLSSVAILWFGAHPVSSGEMPIGNLIAFLQYVMQILFAVMMAVFMFILVPRAVVSSARIQEVLQTDPSINDPAAAAPPPPGTGTLEFDDVEFRYPGAEDPVLRDISFRVEPGQTTAIVGSTGSGKSTLINLIPRFYDVSEGRLSIDGTDVRELDRTTCGRASGSSRRRRSCSRGTIASNLRFGKADATDDELWDALRVAQAETFVRELAEGLDAPVTQGGTNLSGGQRQRLAIARALVKRARDLRLRRQLLGPRLQDRFAPARGARARDRGRHRRSSSPSASGRSWAPTGSSSSTAARIVGIGTHAELMASCETYREIVYSQLSTEEAA